MKCRRLLRIRSWVRHCHGIFVTGQVKQAGGSFPARPLRVWFRLLLLSTSRAPPRFLSARGLIPTSASAAALAAAWWWFARSGCNHAAEWEYLGVWGWSAPWYRCVPRQTPEHAMAMIYDVAVVLAVADVVCTWCQVLLACARLPGAHRMCARDRRRRHHSRPSNSRCAHDGRHTQ